MEEEYEKVVNADEGNQAHLSHEIIAAAASYEATKAWEKHKASTGGRLNFPSQLTEEETNSAQKR
ncbi:hypothetical protein APSETT445_008180 [Aspergillus pseudonomiae]